MENNGITSNGTSNNSNNINKESMQKSDGLKSKSEKKKVKEECLSEKLQYFSNTLTKRIERVDDEYEKQNQILNDTLNEYVNCLKKQKEEIGNEIKNFYDHKKLSLQNALDDTKRLNEFHEKLNNPIIRKNLNKMADELIYLTENLMNKVIFFQKNFDHLNSIGELETPTYEIPIKEHIILLQTPPKKIIHTKKGFLSWHENNKIVELMFGRTIISEKENILDVCSTFDNRLSYIVHVDSKFFCKTLNLENDEWVMKGFSYQFDSLSNIKFGVFRKNIIITSGNGKVRYIPRTDVKAIEHEKVSSSKLSFIHKSFNEGLCVDYKDHAEYFLDNGEHVKFSIKKQETTNYSLYDNVINELTKGLQMYSDTDNLTIMDIESKLGFTLEQEKLFPGKRLMDYHMNNNQVVFCLSDKENPRIITLQYFPNFQDDNFYKNE